MSPLCTLLCIYLRYHPLSRLAKDFPYFKPDGEFLRMHPGSAPVPDLDYYYRPSDMFTFIRILSCNGEVQTFVPETHKITFDVMLQIVQQDNVQLATEESDRELRHQARYYWANDAMFSIPTREEIDSIHSIFRPEAVNYFITYDWSLDRMVLYPKVYPNAETVALAYGYPLVRLPTWKSVPIPSLPIADDHVLPSAAEQSPDSCTFLEDLADDPSLVSC